MEAFVPWEKHVEAFEGWNAEDPRTIKAATLPAGQSAYTRADLLEYIGRVIAKVPHAIDELDLDGASGFDFLPFNKLELQFYNLRHIQHHAGQLIERVRQNQDEGVAWVGWTPP
jgi:hypothetical protein